MRCGLPLKIAAKVDRVDRDYFEREIRPLLDLPGIEYIGEIGDEDKSDFLSGALALLMPIDWPEPFGLVMIEAMACGTPVIAYPQWLGAGGRRGWRDRLHRRQRGAAAEAIDNQLAGLSRQKIRARFEERFTARRMAGDYVAVYRGLMAGAKRPLRTVNGSAKPNSRPQDGRHQTGIDGGLYIGD